MGAWRDLCAPLAAALLLSGMSAHAGAAGSASLPAGQAENAALAPARTGRVAPAPSQAEASLKAILAAVRTDAAALFGVQVAAVRVQAEEVVWSDGALGCAGPGVIATQAQVPGWRLSVTAASAWAATYHASKQGYWRLCTSGSQPGASVER